MDFDPTTFRLNGFRSSLEEATRIDDDGNDGDDGQQHDWSVHTVDYAQFKSRLRQYSRRRAQVRQLIRQSDDGGTISAGELDALLFGPTAVASVAVASAQPVSSSWIPLRDGILRHDSVQDHPAHDPAQPQQRHVATSSAVAAIPLSTSNVSSVTTSPEESESPYVPLGDDNEGVSGQPHHSQHQQQQQQRQAAAAAHSDSLAVPFEFIGSRRPRRPRRRPLPSRGGGGDEEEGSHTSMLVPRLTAAASGGAAGFSFWPLFASSEAQERLNRRTAMRRLSNWERNDLVLFLSAELDKVAMFYLARWQRLTTWLEEVQLQQQRQRGDNSGDVEDADARLLLLLRLGGEILELHAFCAANIVAVRQMLIRYDAFARANEGTPMMQYYMKMVKSSSVTPSPPDSSTTMSTQQSHRQQQQHQHTSCLSFRKILRHEEVLALGDSYVHHLQQLQQQQQLQPQHLQQLQQPRHTQATTTLAAAGPQFEKERAQLQSVVRSSETAEATSSSGHAAAPLHDTVLHTLRHYFVLGMLEDRLGLEPSYLTARGRSLTSEMRLLARWRRRSLYRQWTRMGGGSGTAAAAATATATATFTSTAAAVVAAATAVAATGGGCLATAAGAARNNNSLTTKGASLIESYAYYPQTGERSFQDGTNEYVEYYNGGDDDWMVKKPDDQLSKQETFNLFMALTAGFLYCMNYYIVEPSSTMYVNALGAHDAMSATLIGMMPIASFMAAIMYSIWTNKSFRHPFLVSCTLMVAGNVVYSAAYNFKSLPLALAGRFMTGLGGPKCIIRRYMADTTSLSIRTSVNALFGMAVAAGSALGPGCAILLNRLDFAVRLPHFTVWVNGMTGPGWFMAASWSCFSVALYWKFRELDRVGLREQLERDHGVSAASVQAGGGGGGGGDDGSLAVPAGQRGGGGSSSIRDNNYGGESNLRPNASDGGDTTSNDDLATLMSGRTSSFHDDGSRWGGGGTYHDDDESLWEESQRVATLVTFPVRVCLGLLFAKVFVIETLVSCTSSLSKNRYGWEIHEVGLLGCVNGLFVIPLSMMVGKLSMSYQDRFLMLCLLSVGIGGLSLLIDVTDLLYASETRYNEGRWLAVGPARYVLGYFFTYVSIQSFEGVIGSALSKVIPTSLATGTFNSGLLATLVDTFGRSCGDLFISLMGIINIRQLMNLLFIPGVCILLTCFIVVRRYYDLLAV